MLLNTAGISTVSKALSAANTAAASSKGGPKYKKAPDAPKRFKSAFIIFSAEKHKEIKEDLISQGRTEKVSVTLLRFSLDEVNHSSNKLIVVLFLLLIDYRYSQACVRGLARNAGGREGELGKESS